MCNKEQGYYQSQIDPSAAADLERADWSPVEALRFYSDGKHFDVVEGKTRILDTGSIASNALKHTSLEYLEHKGDAELFELRARVFELEEMEGYVLAGDTYGYGIKVGMEKQAERVAELEAHNETRNIELLASVQQCAQLKDNLAEKDKLLQRQAFALAETEALEMAHGERIEKLTKLLLLAKEALHKRPLV